MFTQSPDIPIVHTRGQRRTINQIQTDKKTQDFREQRESFMHANSIQDEHDSQVARMPMSARRN